MVNAGLNGPSKLCYAWKWCRILSMKSAEGLLRYIYVHVSQFSSCAEDREKSGSFVCLESVNPVYKISHLLEWLDFLVAKASDQWPVVVSSSVSHRAVQSSNNLGQVVHTYVPLSQSTVTWYQWKLGAWTGTPHDALAPYTWSHSINWCLAGGWGNGDQHCPEGPHGITFFASPVATEIIACMLDVVRMLMTGSYNNHFRLFDRETQRDVTFEASRHISKPKQPLKPRRVGYGNKRKKDEVSVDVLDFSHKVLHATWHPTDSIYALAATNSLYIYHSKD